MRSSFPTRDQLAHMSLNALRSLDIREKDEEDLVQDVLNAKLAHSPQPAKISLSFVDITTKEQEDARQKEIDELNEKSRQSLLQGVGVEAPMEVPLEIPLPEGLPVQPVVEEQPVEEVVAVKKKGRPKKVK